MLSLLPQLLFLAPFSALLIRGALALTIAFAAWKHWDAKEWWARALGLGEAAVAVFLLVGLWTQAAALLAGAAVLAWLFLPRRLHALPRSTALLALVLALSLLVTGAGALAFDLPL